MQITIRKMSHWQPPPSQFAMRQSQLAMMPIRVLPIVMRPRPRPRLRVGGGKEWAMPIWVPRLRQRVVLPLPTRMGGVAGYFEKKKCQECKSDNECGLGLTCTALSTDPTKFRCRPRKTDCGVTRRCYGQDSCPCSGNPFKTCQCTGPETTLCPN